MVQTLANKIKTQAPKPVHQKTSVEHAHPPKAVPYARMHSHRPAIPQLALRLICSQRSPERFVLASIEFPVMPGDELQCVDPGWRPPIAPNGDDQKVYIVRKTLRRAHCETGAERVNMEPVINAGLHGAEQRRRIDQFIDRFVGQGAMAEADR
jgi:hypothetical protein